MSRKTRTHLRGERGKEFADQIRDIPLDQILCVSLDISKYFHIVMIYNVLGDIVTPTFEIGILQRSFDHLCQVIDGAVASLYTNICLSVVSFLFRDQGWPGIGELAQST